MRASIGIPLAGAAMWAAASRAYDAGQVALIAGTLASVAVAAMMITSMRAQLADALARDQLATRRRDDILLGAWVTNRAGSVRRA